MFFDAHTHVHFAAYDSDREAVIGRAKEAGVQMLTVGTQIDTSRGGIALAKQHAGHIWAAVGLHPIHTSASYHDKKELGGGESAKAFVSRGETFDFDLYESLAKQKEVVAIGECGLDYYRTSENPALPAGRSNLKSQIEIQKEVFKEHIRLAESVGKALMIHCRPSQGTDNAYEDMLQLVASGQSLVAIPKIVHFYVGGPAITKKLLDAGFYFTLGGVITFARDYDESIRLIPLQRILLETDAPYVAPEPYRGRKNEPAYIVETAKKVAELKGVSLEEVAEITTKTARYVFGISKLA